MKQAKDGKFRTHVKEPRWQQVASLVLIAILVLLWLASVVFSHH